MKNTNIQWCHSTINPVAGCDGCELWSSPAVIIQAIVERLAALAGLSQEELKERVPGVVGRRDTSAIYKYRLVLAKRITGQKSGPAFETVVDVIREKAKCYAGLLGTNRAGVKGYVDQFEVPKLFPGRMAEAASWESPTNTELHEKAWLKGIPWRLIFISDMGDALSKNVPFQYLDQEIIESVTSAEGRRHQWLWLTKRPARMAGFARYLEQQGKVWPENLMAMTTVTSQATAGRIGQLRKVPSRLRGLSVEPLLGPVKLDLSGIDWVIVGGGSDVLARPLHVEWALDLRRQCQAAGVAFFLKTTWQNPFSRGLPMKLNHRHGGDWNEWPKEWRTREFPAAFYATNCSLLLTP
ncbi:MAG: Bacteriophage protein gp37 [Verrucomicrobiales bacterium]|nr:Bacteriophage protein gp37 [Verrucomicrobiales bacterium]